jgi:hypothetical protein
MKYAKLILMFATLALAVGCGSSSKSTPAQPLDPQGNWLFTFTGSDGSAGLQFAGQLYELTSPVVTSNEMPSGFPCGGMTVAGQASGTNTINLTVTEVDEANKPTFALVGTIAESQQAMSGTWSTSDAACTDTGVDLGTWTAQELAPVTDTWTGTANNSTAITATLTEVTDQTSPNLGQVTGTVTLSGACFAGPLSVAGGHLGEVLTLSSTPDASGATLSLTGTVDPAAVGIAGSFTVAGGPCDGQTFTANLTHD